MKALIAAALVGGLLLPASAAAAAPDPPTVLSVDRHHRTVELVGANHVVHAYRYRGRLSALPAGTRVAVRRHGRILTAVRALPGHRHALRTVSYEGRVVRSGTHGMQLRLGDGRVLVISAARLARRPPPAHGPSRAHAQGPARTPTPVRVNVLGLPPGVTVLVTQTTDAHGTTTVTITLPATLGAQRATGVVTDIETDTLTVLTADGSQLVLHMAADSLDGLALNECDAVTVTYHQDGELLVADDVQDAGAAPSGGCTAASTQDVTGTIAQVWDSGLTIAGLTGSLTFAADPSEELTDGFLIGDAVDVTYTTAGSGALTAVDVEYDEQELTGAVTTVSPAAVTLTPDTGGPPQTFVADPADGMFDGVHQGDELDVSYHASPGGLVADAVDDAGQ